MDGSSGSSVLDEHEILCVYYTRAIQGRIIGNVLEEHFLHSLDGYSRCVRDGASLGVLLCTCNNRELFGFGCLARFSELRAYCDAYQTLTQAQMSHILGNNQENRAYGIVSAVGSKEITYRKLEYDS